MRIIIDGYNLLRHNQGLNRLACRDLKGAREQLLKRLESYRRVKGHSLEVVFDAWKGDSPRQQEERFGGIKVIYSPSGQNADEVIKGIARTFGNGVVVVTSDREVADYASAQGSPVITAGEFEKKLVEVFLAKETAGPVESHPSKTKGPSRMLKKKDRRSRTALRNL